VLGDVTKFLDISSKYHPKSRRLFRENMIEITRAAAAEIARMRALGAANTTLRLTLGSGTCEQFYYELGLTTKTPTDDLVMRVGDLVVSIDFQHRQYLENIQVDFAQDLMGGGFRFQNPQAKKVCGCGNAFSV
jgi:iron-sulfur cluster assembly protein